jgi:hypothetical protein
MAEAAEPRGEGQAQSLACLGSSCCSIGSVIMTPRWRGRTYAACMALGCSAVLHARMIIINE